MDSIPPQPPDVLLETSDPDQSLDFDFDDTDDLLADSSSTFINSKPPSSIDDNSPQNTPPINDSINGNFQCELCGQFFPSIQNLQNHIALSHSAFSQAQFVNHVITTAAESAGGLSAVPFDLLTAVVASSSASVANFSNQSLNLVSGQIPLNDFVENQQGGPLPVGNEDSLTITTDAFKCGVCSQHFGDIRVFEKHMLSHGEERSYTCPQCPKTYKYKWDLNRHFERKHMNVNNTSNDTNQVDFDASQFINNFQCNVCSKNFLEKAQFELHCQETKCGRLLNEVSDIDQSSDEDENGHPAIFKCYNCPQSFDSRLLFKQHKLLHLRLYSCSKCDEKFVKFDSFHAHGCNATANSVSSNMSNVNVQGTVVSQNGNQVLNFNSLANSVTSSHAIRDVVSPSSFTGVPVNELNNVSDVRASPLTVGPTQFLTGNVSIQQQLSQIPSSISDNSLANNNLAGTLGSPHQQQQFICQICDSVFTHKAIYDRHCAIDCRLDCRLQIGQSRAQTSNGAANDDQQINNQTPQNSVNTEESTRFSASPALSVTGSSNSRETSEINYTAGNIEIIPNTTIGSGASNVQPTPDPCEICGKRFATLSNLKRHMMSHSKIRNFKCPYCHKSYIYKWDLTNHIKKAHKGMSIDEVKPLYSTRDFYNENAEHKRRRNPARSSNNNASANQNSPATQQSQKSNKNAGNMQCKHCGGIFVGQNSLHAHMILRHSGVIDDANDITNELMHFVDHYTCSFCGKSFSDKRIYRSHLATHSEGNSDAAVTNLPCTPTSNVANGLNMSNLSSSPEIYCNGCKAELMTEGIDLPSDEDVEYLCDVCDNERRRQEEAAGLSF